VSINENLTPAELPVGTPSDTSVVHSSENNETTNSKGHNERDISRLQGTARAWIADTAYNAGDLVFRDGIVWRSNNGQATQPTFDPLEWDPVSPNAQPFTVNREYVSGDLVTEEGIVYRANTTIPVGVQGVVTDTTDGGLTLTLTATNSNQVMAGDFIDVLITSPTSVQLLNKEVSGTSPTEITIFLNGEAAPQDGSTGTWESAFTQNLWSVVGVGSKNVVQVFDQSDFPPVDMTTMQIPLDDETEYIICAPITITNPFFINAGFEVMMRAFADEVNSISVDVMAAEALFNSNTTKNDITATTSIGGGQLEVTTSDSSGLQTGELVNLILESPTAINFFSKEIVSVDSGTQFTIDLGGETAPADSTGNYDQGIKVLELEDLVIKDIVGARVLSTTFSRTVDSECFVFHVIVEGFTGIGTITDVGQFSWESSNFFGIQTGFTLIDVRRAFLTQLSIQQRQAVTTTADIIIEGNETEFVDINSIVFETSPNQFAILIDDSMNPINADTEIHVENCKDINFVSSLFDTTVMTNLDEKDPRMFVHDCGKQKDSETQAMTSNSGESNLLPGSFIPIDGWSEDTSERFTFTGGTGGIFTYDGLADVTVIINYNVTFQNDSGGGTLDQFSAAIFDDISGSPMLIARTENSTQILDTQFQQVCGSAILLIDPGTELQLRVNSNQGAGSYAVIGARFTMHAVD